MTFLVTFTAFSGKVAAPGEAVRIQNLNNLTCWWIECHWAQQIWRTWMFVSRVSSVSCLWLRHPLRSHRSQKIVLYYHDIVLCSPNHILVFFIGRKCKSSRPGLCSCKETTCTPRDTTSMFHMSFTNICICVRACTHTHIYKHTFHAVYMLKHIRKY